MATYDDFDGVWFTVQSICMYHPEVLADLSFVVVDNHPAGVAAASLRGLAGYVDNYRYVPFAGYTGTSVRDQVFRESSADVVCCVDSHVLLVPGALTALQRWFALHPDSDDLLQGPIVWDDLRSGTTHMEPTWRDGMFGIWGTVPELPAVGEAPFEIGLHGLGMFACRRAAWPGINPRFRGFGGEEGYLHEKFRRNGGRVLCHPALRWAHRFGRPAGPAYPNVWEERIRNYVIGWSELGWDLEPVQGHFQTLLGARAMTVWQRAREQADHPLHAFDGVFCSGRGDTCSDESHPLAVAWRVEHAEQQGAGDPRLSRIGAWRSALREAVRRGYAATLVLNPGATVIDVHGAGRWFDCDREWRVRELGPGAVAVHRSAYAQILVDLGEDDAGSLRLLAEWGDFDSYLEQFHDGGERPRPAVAIDTFEHADGIAVRRTDSGRVFELNASGTLVFELCDGTRTVRQIAGALGRAFALAAPPLDEVAAYVSRLRAAGILEAAGASAGAAGPLAAEAVNPEPARAPRQVTVALT